MSENQAGGQKGKATTDHRIRKMNQNLTATIYTKYAEKREIKIKDSIRQGGVLSVLQYGWLIDDISKEITKKQPRHPSHNFRLDSLLLVHIILGLRHIWLHHCVFASSFRTARKWLQWLFPCCPLLGRLICLLAVLFCF